MREIEDTLTAVAQEIQPPKKGPSGPVKWELQWRSWEQVRPYEWPDLTSDQRTRMARKGRLAFGQMNLPNTDPLWEHFKTRVLDANPLPQPSKGKAKAVPGQTLLKNPDFRGGMYPKEKKPSTKQDGAASSGATKAKASSTKSKTKKDQEDDFGANVRKVPAADTKDKAKASSVSSTASSVPVARIPKRKQQEETLAPSSKARKSIVSNNRESSPPSKSLRIQDEGGHKRKPSVADTDGASEMEEGEVPIGPNVKKRKITDVGESNKSRMSSNLTGNGDLPVKKGVREKIKVTVKEESLPPKLARDTISPRVSVGASSSRIVSAGGKSQRLEKEERDQDTERLKEREHENRRSSGKRGRRATPSFSSDEEEEEPPKKLAATSTRTPASAPPKSKPSQHPPSSKVVPPGSKAASSRVLAPSPVLPSDKDALRRRYNTCYARYMGVTSKFHEQRAKVEALLATDADSMSADDDIEMMDTEELMQLRGEHERLRDELQRIQHAHASEMVF